MVHEIINTLITSWTSIFEFIFLSIKWNIKESYKLFYCFSGFNLYKTHNHLVQSIRTNRLTWLIVSRCEFPVSQPKYLCGWNITKEKLVVAFNLYQDFWWRYHRKLIFFTVFWFDLWFIQGRNSLPYTKETLQTSSGICSFIFSIIICNNNK